MPFWWVTEPGATLFLSDKPLFYNTSRGTEIGFQLHYKNTPGIGGKTDCSQPGIFSVGTNWHSPWRSYMQKVGNLDPSTPTNETFYIFLGDGSAREYTTGLNFNEYSSHAALTTNIGEYWLTFPLGSRNVYGQKVTLNGNDYWFLTRKEDANGNVTQFAYSFTTNNTGATNSVRLNTVTDPDSRQTTFSYASHAYYSNILTQVTGPAGQIVTLTCNPQAQLTNIIDVISLTNRMDYDSGGRLSHLITPYGTNQFTYSSGGSGWKGILVDELGLRQHFYLDSYSPTNVLSTAPSESLSLSNFLYSHSVESTLETGLFDPLNSFYWGPRQYQNLPQSIRTALTNASFNPDNLTTNDYKLGWTRHWLRSVGGTNVTVPSDTLSVERRPSPDANGLTEGLLTWYDHFGKTTNEYVGHERFPRLQAYREPGADWNVSYFQRNTFGHPISQMDSISVLSTDIDVPHYWIFAWDWRTSTFQYADNGIDLVSVRFGPVGADRLLSSNIFNLNHQVTTNYDALSQVSKFEYNANHQITKATLPSDQVTEYAYAGSGFLSTVIDKGVSQSFRTNTYTWTNGWVLTHTDPRGRSTTNSWDALGRLTKTTFPDGTAVNNTFDKLDLVKTTDRLGFTNAYAFNGFGQLRYKTNANGRVTTYQYCNCGSLDSVTDPLGNITSFSYDNLGRRLAVTYPDLSWASKRYNLLNMVAGLTSSAGLDVTNMYHIDGRLRFAKSGTAMLNRFIYDDWGRLTNSMDGNGSITGFVYDDLSRIISRSVIDGSSTWHSGDTDYSVEQFAYSARGLVSRTSPSNHVRLYQYDELGRKVTETNANLEVSSFTYSPAGDLTALTDAKSHATTWKYDLYGRVTNKVDAANNVLFRYKYDADNRLTNRWSAAKGDTYYTYDAAGSLTLVDYAVSPDITLAYDANNRLTNMVDVRISVCCKGGRSNKAKGLVVGERGRFSVREEVVPAGIAPEGFQAHEGLITLHGPELARALEPTLVLPASGLDGS